MSRGRRARGGGRDFLGLDPRDTRSNRGWHGFNRQVDASEVRMEWTARERIRNKTTPPCCSINMGSLSSFLRAPKRPDRQRIHQKRNSPPLLFNKHGFTVSFLPRPPVALPIRSLSAPSHARWDGIVPPTNNFVRRMGSPSDGMGKESC